MRAFAAQTGLLDPTKGHMLGRQNAHVDADHAVLQGLAHAEDATHVAAIEIAGEAEFGVVGGVDGFLLGLELEHRRKRAKGFLAGAQHVGRGVGHHGGLEELPLQPLATHQHTAALGLGIVHMALHFFQCGLLDQRALVHAVVKAVAHLGGFHLGGKLGHELVVHALLHVDAVGAHAGLPGVAVLAGKGAFHGGVDVRVVEHDEWRIAAQFQRQLLHRGRALRHEDAAHLGGAGEAQVAHHVAGA